MWSTFLVTDEEGRTVNPAAAGSVGAPAGPGGPPPGPVGLANLMSGRSTFGGNKRRRTTSTGPTMSEAQEGKVKGPRWAPPLRLCRDAVSLMEPINHAVALFQLKSGSTGRQTLHKSRPRTSIVRKQAFIGKWSSLTLEEAKHTVMICAYIRPFKRHCDIVRKKKIESLTAPSNLTDTSAAASSRAEDSLLF